MHADAGLDDVIYKSVIPVIVIIITAERDTARTTVQRSKVISNKMKLNFIPSSIT
jgi:hypothetical protein